jgi:hypothetical protein
MAAMARKREVVLSLRAQDGPALLGLALRAQLGTRAIKR